MPRITIEDVAKASGVSATTVSHVFSGHRPVSPRTRKLVEKVARDLGYTPSAVAQSLRSRRTYTIMIVVPDITNAFWPVFARSVQDVVGPDGYHAMFGNTDARLAEEEAFLDEARSRRVDGVVFIGFRLPASRLVGLAESGVAVVNLGETPPGSRVDSARFDDQAAAAQATKYLLERYGPSVALIYGDEEAPAGRERRLGFEEACRAQGTEPDATRIVKTAFTREGGVTGMRRLLDLPQPPRAVLCANDMIALGAIDVAKERGLRVPKDIAIVGHDDIDAATIVTPQLTTTRTDARLLGEQAAGLLLSRMKGEVDGEGRHIVIPHQLVVRESA